MTLELELRLSNFLYILKKTKVTRLSMLESVRSLLLEAQGSGRRIEHSLLSAQLSSKVERSLRFWFLVVVVALGICKLEHIGHIAWVGRIVFVVNKSSRGWAIYLGPPIDTGGWHRVVSNAAGETRLACPIKHSHRLETCCYSGQRRSVCKHWTIHSKTAPHAGCTHS